MSTKSTEPDGLSPNPNDQDNDARGAEASPQSLHSIGIQLASLKAADILREERRRGMLTFFGLSSAAAIILVALGGFLVNEVLDVRVNERVRGTIHEELSDVNFKIDLFVFRAEYEDAFEHMESDGVVSGERLERAFEEAERLVETYILDPDLSAEETRGREQAILHDLEKLIDISASVDRKDLINDFHNLSPKLLEKSDLIIQTLVQHYGRQLIGRAGAPRVWYDRIRTRVATEEYQRYSELAERARDTGYPEVFLAFELVIRYIEERPRDEITSLIDDAETLNEEDKLNFIRLMLAHASGAFVASAEPGAANVRVVRHYVEFIDAYQDYSELIAKIDEMLSQEDDLVSSTMDQWHDGQTMLG